MVIGYARVSTTDQNLDLQKDELNRAGCEKIFEDKGVSGSKFDRTGLNAAIEHLRRDDILVVWKLDRLGRTLKDLIEVVNSLKERGIGFRSLREAIDTTSPAGKLVFHIFASLAEFERNLIIERTTAGLAAARSRGRLGGRKPVLTKRQITIGKTLYESKNASISEICEQLKCSRATFYRHIQKP